MPTVIVTVMVVIAPPDHPLAAQASVGVAALTEHTFVIREPESATRAVSERALSQHGVHLTNTIRVGGIEAVKRGVAAGLGLAVVSRAAAADQLALGQVVVLAVDGLVIRRPLTQIRLRGRRPSVAARELEALLAEDAAERSVGDASGNAGR